MKLVWAPVMPRHSKIQLQVLRLYKEFMRAAQHKPGMNDHVRLEFKKNAVIPRTDTLRIEHILRRADRQLNLLKKPSVTSMGVFQRDEEKR